MFKNMKLKKMVEPYFPIEIINNHFRILFFLYFDPKTTFEEVIKKSHEIFWVNDLNYEIFLI